MVFIRSYTLLSFLFLLGISRGLCQDLDHIPPVTAGAITESYTNSYVIAANDLHRSELKKPQKYFNCLQIFDAGVPFPPRWYYAIPYDNTPDDDTGAVNQGLNALNDARFQDGYFTFYRVKRAARKEKGFHSDEMAGYIICNKNMQAIDTINSTRTNIIDPHDLRMNHNGERILMTYFDTVLNISRASENPADTARPASVTVIEIMDSTNKIIFRWNSASVLGANSIYYPDLKTHTYFKQKKMDWSHGNTARWDADGNILYSLRYIGVGKISREDGHVMWRLNRRDMPIILGRDTLEFYAQHDFEPAGDTGNYYYYSLFSDGKRPDHLACGIVFKVNKQTNEVKLVSTKMPDVPMVTDGAGNFERYSDGSYLMSYGQYPLKDSSESDHFFMELRNPTGKVYAKYMLPSEVFTYKVHRLPVAGPPRPDIIRNKKTLTASGPMSNWVWYRLSKPGNTLVTKVGEGVSFTPGEPGIYCVEGRYGIGCAVSNPFVFAPEGKTMRKK